MTAARVHDLLHEPNFRRAYGWQRDGGMAEYLVAEEKDLAIFPPSLSLFRRRAGRLRLWTAYEGLQKVALSGGDSVLITGLGPVGLATAALSRKLGAHTIIGADILEERLALTTQLGLCDHTLHSNEEALEQIRTLTAGAGVDVAVDCSANPAARALAIQATGKWGRVLFLGEGGIVTFNPSSDLMHEQKTIFGSWVSLWRMEELVDRLVRWNLHPDRLVTHRFPLEKASEAYALMASGKCGKVAVCFDEELNVALDH